MEEKLIKILEYYRNKFRLKTQLLFISCPTNNHPCLFDFEDGIIYFNYEYIDSHLQYNNRYFLKFDIATRNKKIIFLLLHEIYHSIDSTFKPKRFKQEWEEAAKSSFLYYRDTAFHDSRPFEIRANKFAKKEIERKR